jgi:hypothetical protein
MDNHSDPEMFEKARNFKKEAVKNFKLTLKQLGKSFITPIEREDIQYIASLLQKITKKIIKAYLNLEVYQIKETTEQMKEQATTLVKAAGELCSVVKQLERLADVEGATRSNIRMKDLETKGDQVLREAIRELFSGKYDAIDIIKYRDIYKEIEIALDACYSVSDIVLRIVLKEN